MSFLRNLSGAAFAIWLGAAAVSANETVRVGVIAGGTVMWELQAIRDLGLDTENGFTLSVTELAGNPATQIAMQGGEVDTIVSDWLWVAQQRAAGSDFVFYPYSTAVGGVMVAADSPAQSLADLAGGKIGIAGGPVDKSWLILRAYAAQELGFDLAAQTEQVFGAPPLIMQAAASGEVDGAVNFWHFMAKMRAAGMRDLISVAEASEALGLDPDTPLLGYVLRESWIAENPQLAAGLAAASRAAKERLASDDAAWDALRPIMNAANDAEFEALRDGWRAGIPADAPVDTAQVAASYALMAELGGDELTGGVTELPAGLFWQP